MVLRLSSLQGLLTPVTLACLQFASSEVATEFQHRLGHVFNAVGLVTPLDVERQIDAHNSVELEGANERARKTAIEAEKAERAKAAEEGSLTRNSDSIRVRTPRPDTHALRRRSQAFGNKTTFDHQAAFSAPSAMDTSLGSMVGPTVLGSAAVAYSPCLVATGAVRQCQQPSGQPHARGRTSLEDLVPLWLS